MQKNTGKKRFTFCLLFLFTGLIGVSLIFGITPSYAQTPKALVDLNTASDKDLQSIKGIGPVMAKKIIAGRPYTSVDDLRKAGIPEKTIVSIKPYVRVGAAPVSAKPEAGKKVGTPARTTSPQQPVIPPPPAKRTIKEVPVKAMPAPAERAKSPAKVSTQPPARLAPGQVVNLNTATKEQLEALPDIGPVKAQAIIDGRPYKNTQDIMKIKGIKEGTFNKIKDYITVR